MAREKRGRNILALTGAAALAAVALNLAFSAFNALKDRRRRKNSKDIPGSAVFVNLTAPQILALADEIIAKSKQTFDQMASTPIEKITYQDVILPLVELEAKQFSLIQSCIFPRMVSTSSDVRKASAEAERKLDSHFNLCCKREDVYRVLKVFLEREDLSPQVKHLVKHLVRDFHRNGAGLSMNQKQELENLKSQIEKLSLQYIENLNKESNFLLLDEQDLDGMPLEFIKCVEKSEHGKLKVLLRSNIVSSILEHCKVGAIRRLVAVAHGQRCAEDNLHILENLVALRHKLARLLGYPNYVDYALESRMPKTSSKVFEFLEGISINMNDMAIRELGVLKELKEKEEESSLFGMEDMLYYMNKAEEQIINDRYALTSYLFPIKSVLTGIFKTLQDLFGLEIKEYQNMNSWHASVRLFAVSDSSSHELLGYFYLDIFSREGKYTQTCVLALQNGCSLDNGARQVPITLLISSFPKQADQNSCVLQLSDVITLFHELGHVVHQMCNCASFSRFSGLRMDADFVEIPGQMLENWCYEESFLNLISSFSQGHDNNITSEVCKQLKKMRDSFSGLKLKQEILLCLIDFIVHSSDNVDIVELVKHLHPKVMLGIPLLEGTNPASCFPRLAVGYDASCYSYLWSEVFATDIFQSKFQYDIWNKHAGLQFRNKVLAPGGAKDPFEILKDYLGREPSFAEYIERKTRNSFCS